MPRTWALITVAYNSARVLEKYWSEERPTNVKWIVVDNASSDDSVQVARSLGAAVITLPENLGFSGANNAGLEHVESEYVAFVNPDVRVDYGTLELLEVVITATEGIVGPQLRYDDGSMQPNGRGFPTLQNKVLNRLGSERVTNRYFVLAEPGEWRSVCWVIGAAVAGRTSDIRFMGGWDDHFFLYYEDSDIGLRAWKAGIPVTLAGDVTWTHGWARETSKLNFRAWRREIPSMVKFYRRYPSLLWSERFARRRNRDVANRLGELVELGMSA